MGVTALRPESDLGATTLSHGRDSPRTGDNGGRGGRTDGQTDDGRTTADGRTTTTTDGRRLGAERELTERIENYKTFRVTVHAILEHTLSRVRVVYGLGVTPSVPNTTVPNTG